MIRDFFNENEEFKYLKAYYNGTDSASRYGVARMEIKHSNFLAWLLDPNNTGSINPIRNLLLLIQSNNKDDNQFSKLDLNKAKLSEVKIRRESVENIDLFITVNINEDKYAFIIENKIYASIHDNQLKRYRASILSNPEYSGYNVVCGFLYTEYQPYDYKVSQLKEVKEAEYIPFTYQMVYENVLLPMLDYAKDNSLKFIVDDYIHCLASYTLDDGANILIVTKQDRECLTRLFQEDKMIQFIEEIKNSKEDNEYTSFYNENKSLLLMCFNKYLETLYENQEGNEQLISKLTSIISNKKYIMNGTPYRGIGSLLQTMFTDLFDKGHTFEELDEMFNRIYSDPLIVPVDKIENVEHPRWFTTYPKTIEIDSTNYYVLSAWNSWDYEDLKDNINNLNIGITLE